MVTTDWNSITGEQILETMEKKQTLSAELEHLRKEACEEEAEHNHDHHHHNHENHNHKEEHHHHDHEGCSCGHHHKHDDSSHGHHHHHNHHHADEVFDEFGVETSHKFTKEIMEDDLKELMKEERAGMVLRAKGIVECDNGEWIHFDYVPGEPEVRIGAAATTGMICVIGTGLKKDVIKEIFGL